MRQHAADAAHPQNAEVLAEHLDAVELGRAPPRPGATADQVDTLGRAPGGAEQEEHPDLGDGLAQRVRQAEHRDIACAGRREIEVLMPGRVGCDRTHACGKARNRCGIERLLHRDHHDRLFAIGQQCARRLIGCDVFRKHDIAHLPQVSLDLLRQAAGCKNTQAFRRLDHQCGTAAPKSTGVPRGMIPVGFTRVSE